MRHSIWILLVATTAIAMAAEDLNSLNAYAGRWKGAGESKDTPYSKAGPSGAETNCNWSPNHGFLICDQMVRNGEGNDLSIYTYDEKEHSFAFYGISRGNPRARTTKLSIEGKRWTYSSEFENNGKRVQIRTVNEFTSPDLVVYRTEYSEDGEHWILMGEGANRRVE